jgi:hypothetical protein
LPFNINDSADKNDVAKMVIIVTDEKKEPLNELVRFLLLEP